MEKEKALQDFIYDGEHEPEEEILEGDDAVEIIDSDEAEKSKSWIDNLIGD
jgi:hypothetical protein